MAIKKVRKFLEINGWTEETKYNDENIDVIVYYHKSDFPDIEIYLDEIVFVGDVGDFCHIPISGVSHYALLGFMMVNKLIDNNFVWPDYKS
jgi:hypothetical protein